MHVARLKHPGPATEETWVTDGAGDPLLVVMAEPSDSLAAQIRSCCRTCAASAATPRNQCCASTAAAGPRTCSPRHRRRVRPAHLPQSRQPGKDIPDIGDGKFTAAAHAGDDGRQRRYDLADTRIELPVTSGEHKGEVLDLRQVTRRDKGRQIHILTTRDTAALPAAGVVYR